MGVAIGLALTQPLWSIFLTFTALALGLAAPYVLLTLQPQWARILPKPGVWMEKFRQALAFPMFCAVIWLVWVFAQQQGATGAALLLFGLLLLAMSIWIVNAFRGGWARNIAAVAVLAIAVAVPLSVHGDGAPSQTPPDVTDAAGTRAGNSQGPAWHGKPTRRSS